VTGSESTASRAGKDHPKWKKFLAHLSYADSFVGENFRLYGQLRKCRFGHWWLAFSEVFITLFFGLMPLWVPLIAFPMAGQSSITVNDIVWDQVKNGELYIIASSLLAPIYYFTFLRYGRDGGFSPFPSQQVLILIFICTLILAVIAIVASKVTNGGQAIPPHMVKLSLYLLVVCTFIFFITLAARNSIEEVTEATYDQGSRREEELYPPAQAGETAEAEDPDSMIADIINQHSVAS
jgi:hypothetical protein